MMQQFPGYSRNNTPSGDFFAIGTKIAKVGLATAQATQLPLIAALVLSNLSPAAWSKEPVEQGIWRKVENDGINCLYLQLCWCGYAESYETFLHQLDEHDVPQDFKSLASVAESLGYDLVPARLTLHDLENANLPIIVHLEQTDQASGFFVLVIGFDQRDALIIHGGKSTFELFPRDMFRREWSGFGLVPKEQADWLIPLRRGGAGLMLVWAVVVAGNKLLRRRSQC